MEHLAAIETLMQKEEILTALLGFRPYNLHAWEEIVRNDGYRLARLSRSPNVFLDLGANVGTFTAYAKLMFPSSRVVAIEPEQENYRVLSRMTEPLVDVATLRMAVGHGPMWFRRGATCGGHGFLSASAWQTEDDLAAKCEAADVPRAMLDVIIADLNLQPADCLFVKIDIEGGESAFIQDQASTEALRRADTIAMELHPWASSAAGTSAIRLAMFLWLESFLPTHKVEFNLWESGGMAWMNKR